MKKYFYAIGIASCCFLNTIAVKKWSITYPLKGHPYIVITKTVDEGITQYDCVDFKSAKTWTSTLSESKTSYRLLVEGKLKGYEYNTHEAYKIHNALATMYEKSTEKQDTKKHKKSE